MELSYWQSRWRKGNTGFHMQNGYTGLHKHWKSLPIPDSPDVLVPLAGKSVDMQWIAEQGGNVTGIEISEIAIQQFFESLGETPVVRSYADFNIYTSDQIKIWRGNFLKLPEAKMPVFDLIYDKAALVALPPQMRKEYVEKIKSLTGPQTRILLHGYSYNQQEMNGPPFSVPEKEIEELYGSQFSINLLEKNSLNTENFQKFKKRGLGSHFIEYLLLLSKKSERK
jgi:thiopurine S-methyltransferase